MYCATLYLFFIEMMPGRIGQMGWKSIEMMPGQIGWKSIEMMPSQIGWKSIEMMTQMLLHWSNLTDSTRH